jgi:hypothetical protein
MGQSGNRVEIFIRRLRIAIQDISSYGFIKVEAVQNGRILPGPSLLRRTAVHWGEFVSR